jgi:hypothetical protein
MSGPPVDEGLFSGIVLGAFGLLAVLQVVPGALQVWAGYRARTFRSRGLALGALIAGLASSLGCYCAPTALALMVWGIVVLRDPDVRARFAASRVAGT